MIDATAESLIFESTGALRNIGDFRRIDPFDRLVEGSRAGVAAISRGPEPI